VEGGKFQRIRVSTIKAVYYKITFIFGLKYKVIGQARKKDGFPHGIIVCEDCKEKYCIMVNFWDRDKSCPFC